MVIAAIGTVRGGGEAAVGNGAEITFLGAGGVGAPVLGLLVVQCADQQEKGIVFFV